MTFEELSVEIDIDVSVDTDLLLGSEHGSSSSHMASLLFDIEAPMVRTGGRRKIKRGRESTLYTLCVTCVCAHCVCMTHPVSASSAISFCIIVLIISTLRPGPADRCGATRCRLAVVFLHGPVP